MCAARTDVQLTSNKFITTAKVRDMVSGLREVRMSGQENSPIQKLLSSEVKVVNVGLEGFVKDLQDCNVQVVHVEWSPPAGGDPEMAALLAKLGV